MTRALADPAAGAVEMSRWMWVALPAATAGIYAVWGGLMNMIVARQIAELVPDPRASASTLGGVMAVGASIALVAQPILGSLSDRTPGGRLGRRNSWIFWGGLGAALVLVLLAFNHSVAGLAALFGLAVLVLSGAHAALSTVLPERVPPALQGKMSGLCGSMTMLGVLLGVSIAGISPSTRIGYLALAGVLAVVAPLFALTTRDESRAVGPAPAGGALRAMLDNLPGLRTHPDFWWTFASRFSVLLGYNIILGFNLFLLRDHVGFGGGDLALVAREATKVVTVNTVMLLIFSLIGGVLCDATGRIRPFIIASAVLLVPTAMLFWLGRSLQGYYVAQALMGAVFGIYMAVDAVLIARVLPKTGNAARDLGILNVANSGPQAIAPMLAGAVVAMTGNLELLFAIMAVMAMLSAAAAAAIRSVR
ncbi:MFS transporter [Polymorphobacter sp.]|uniref:MFS transporter n=1 Tax=Polymorphobacter sp. TaxID=1909290 RepID=UPI003F701600